MKKILYATVAVIGICEMSEGMLIIKKTLDSRSQKSSVPISATSSDGM